MTSSGAHPRDIRLDRLMVRIRVKTIAFTWTLLVHGANLIELSWPWISNILCSDSHTTQYPSASDVKYNMVTVKEATISFTIAALFLGLRTVSS
jgi:hypothetical protein